MFLKKMFIFGFTILYFFLKKSRIPKVFRPDVVQNPQFDLHLDEKQQKTWDLDFLRKNINYRETENYIFSEKEKVRLSRGYLSIH